MVRARTVVACWLLAGCGFHIDAARGGGDDTPPADAAIDGLPATCTPGQHVCNGRVLETCGANEQWDPAQAHTCDFTCGQDVCVAPSNLPLATVAACTAAAPKLTPAAGTKVILSASGGTHIDCAPDCGDPTVTRIDAVDTLTTQSPSIAYFCLAQLRLPGGVSLGVLPSGGPAAAIAIVVDGDVKIDGNIDLDGGDATSSDDGGRGAPGGYDGSDLSHDDGTPGHGPCAGQGGTNEGSGDHWIGGGGGGGGGKTAGGGGGTGRCKSGDHTAAGSAGGGACGTDMLVPLVGGSGGGSGGDGTTGVYQGWAAGGGGGALQIASRTKITVSGAIRAAGGAGYGSSAYDGGGGGGAGGALLLEAPSLVLTGALVVDGGNGGASGAGAGGAGASGAAGPMPGLTFSINGQGGTGGGGAGGRIRVEGIGAACPATASPAASCTAGALAPE